jgi:hypothetical protein
VTSRLAHRSSSNHVCLPLKTLTGSPCQDVDSQVLLQGSAPATPSSQVYAPKLNSRLSQTLLQYTSNTTIPSAYLTRWLTARVQGQGHTTARLFQLARSKTKLTLLGCIYLQYTATWSASCFCKPCGRSHIQYLHRPFHSHITRPAQVSVFSTTLDHFANACTAYSIWIAKYGRNCSSQSVNVDSGAILHALDNTEHLAHLRALFSLRGGLFTSLYGR